jgi:hypothetical protein
MRGQHKQQSQFIQIIKCDKTVQIGEKTSVQV